MNTIDMENLRDDFAKRAMAAIINGSATPKVSLWLQIKWMFGFYEDTDEYVHGLITYKTAAKVAYDYADAMITERTKRQQL